MTGGVDLSGPASGLRGERVVPWALNMKSEGIGVRSRNGISNFNVDKDCWGFYATERADAWCGLLFDQEGVGRLDAAYNYTVINAALDPGGQERPWRIVGWPSGAVFAAHGASGLKVVYLSPDYAAVALLPTPTSALTATDTGTAGEIVAGDYTYVIQYRDSRTGSKSSYGPVSNTLTLAASRQVLVSGISDVADQTVTHKDVFRSFRNSPGAWYLVGSIQNGVGITTFTDNVPTANQGEAASATNGTQPDGVLSLAAWRARLWVTDGQYLYPSKLLMPMTFNPLDRITVGDTVADPIVTVLDGDNSLIVVKRHSMWALTGTGASSWELNRFDRHRGAIGQFAAFFYGNTLYWVSDDAVYKSEGLSEGVELGDSSQRLRPLFKRLNLLAPNQHVCGPLPSSEGLVFGLRSDRADMDGYQWFYHLPTESWWPWQTDISLTPAVGSRGVRLTALSLGSDPDGNQRVWVGVNLRLGQLDDPSTFIDTVRNEALASTQELELKMELYPRFFDFEDKKGRVATVSGKWRGLALKDEAQPTSDMLGQLRLLVLRERRMDIEPVEQELLLLPKTVDVLPTRMSPPGAQRDEWQRYALNTGGQQPASTIGIGLQFGPHALNVRALSRPILVGAIEVTVQLVNLPQVLA